MGGLIIVLVVIVGSMTLHELAHGVVALGLGDMTAKEDGRLTLNPLKHLDPVMSIVLPLLMFLSGGVVFGGAKPVPVNPERLKGGKWGMAAVAIAGPATNFILAFLGYALWAWLETHGAEGELIYLIAGYIYGVNLGFMVFNLIPIPPLDGSRVIYPLMPDFVQRGMDKIEKGGVLVIYILLVVCGGFFSWLMAEAGETVTGLFRAILGM